MLSILYNLVSKTTRRTLEIPSRGLPKPQSSREPFDEIFDVQTSGVVWWTNVCSENFIHGIRYEPCSPRACKWAIEQSGIDPREFAFIDIGCGKGRSLIIAAEYDFAELIGVEYSPRLCKIATANLEKLHIPARIAREDASRFTFPERDIFAFFYHPFGAPVLNRVLNNLRVGTRIVVAYEGAGRNIVRQSGWLKSSGTMGDTELFRNF